jgi:hypothetical protein
MNLSKMVHTKTGKIVASVLLGFGFATLFRTICKGKNCIVFEAPPLDEIDNQIYKYDDKCYSFHASPVKCDPKKKSVEIKMKH